MVANCQKIISHVTSSFEWVKIVYGHSS